LYDGKTKSPKKKLKIIKLEQGVKQTLEKYWFLRVIMLGNEKWKQ
jgi:hypothetical protein